MDEQGDNSSERQSFLKLTRELVGLPLDKSAAALETSAAIAAISLRTGIEFLRAASAAAEVLEAAELRSWGDLGRRLALGDAENAITFFAAGVAELKDLPANIHPLVFQLYDKRSDSARSPNRRRVGNCPPVGEA